MAIVRLAGTVATERQLAMVAVGDGVVFGRDRCVDLRIGDAPVYDEVVPRRAGRVFAEQGRILVANLDDNLAFDLRFEDRPQVTVSPGDWHAPRDHRFDIVVTGTFEYELAVTVNTAGNPTQVVSSGDEGLAADPPTGAQPSLTERQRSILDAYVSPLRTGGPTASHAQVASTLGISRSLVRLECNKIWSELLVAGVPMREVGDARDQVVDAWSRHRF